jgi:hypothetical protein
MFSQALQLRATPSAESVTSQSTTQQSRLEVELRQKLDNFSEKDVDKLERMLEDIASREGKSEDSRPYMIANVILIALFLLSIVLRQRDEMMHNMTKELLIDTRDELGNEILRLKSSRQEVFDRLLSDPDCNDKCKLLVEKLKQHQAEQDQTAINQILSGIKVDTTATASITANTSNEQQSTTRATSDKGKIKLI